MGYYINQNSKGEVLGYKKFRGLVEDGAMPIAPPTEWREGLVCVIDNGIFDAACYAHSKEEMEACLEEDGRWKRWLQFDKAKELSK